MELVQVGEHLRGAHQLTVPRFFDLFRVFRQFPQTLEIDKFPDGASVFQNGKYLFCHLFFINGVLLLYIHRANRVRAASAF